MENNTAGPNSNVQSQNRTAMNSKQKPKVSPNKKRLATTAVVRPAAAVHSQFQVTGSKAIAPKIHGTILGKPVTLESSIVEVRKSSNANDQSPSSPMQLRPYRAGSIDENLKRPGTVTLSPAGRAASLDRTATGSNDDTLAGTTVCYVCGQRCGRNTVDAHEKKCIHIWECLVAKLPPAIRVYKPHKLQYPSVDGTVDPSRLDSLAQQSSQRSQKVDCSRCRKMGIDLLAAREHVRQCGTKKPDKAPSKESTSGNNSVKPKRKKAKDREIFVNIFA